MFYVFYHLIRIGKQICQSGCRQCCIAAVSNRTGQSLCVHSTGKEPNIQRLCGGYPNATVGHVALGAQIHAERRQRTAELSDSTGSGLRITREPRLWRAADLHAPSRWGLSAEAISTVENFGCLRDFPLGFATVSRPVHTNTIANASIISAVTQLCVHG